MSYHLEQHRIAQDYLDRFARQVSALQGLKRSFTDNAKDKPEIEEIPVVYIILGVRIASAELAGSLEFQQSIDQNDAAMRAPRTAVSKMPDSKTDQIKESSKDCIEPPEAMQKMHCGAKPQYLHGGKWSPAAVWQQRKEEFDDFIKRMLHQLAQGVFTHGLFDKAIPELSSESPWSQWLVKLPAGEGAPLEVIPSILHMIDQMEFNAEDELKYYEDPTQEIEEALAKDLKAIKVKRGPAIAHWDFVELHAALARLVDICCNFSREWVDRLRGMRFLTTMSQCQYWLANSSASDASPPCSACQRPCGNIAETKVLAVCAHLLCANCSANAAATPQYCPVADCDAVGAPSNFYTAASFGEDYEDEYAAKYGAKVGKLIQLIKDNIPEDEQILLFVQFDAVMDRISKALQEEGISNICLSDKNKGRFPTLMQDFQETTGKDAKRVLILDATKDSAAGS